MLKASISLADLSFPPRLSSDEVIFGESYIRPIRHVALECFLVTTTDRWFFIVRERQSVEFPEIYINSLSVSDDNYSQIFDEVLLWPLEYIIIEAAASGTRLRVRTGAHGISPVYFRAKENSVNLSWSIKDFYGSLSFIDYEVCARLLALDTFYSHRTVFSGVNLLTERSSLLISPGSVRFLYPEEMPYTNLSNITTSEEATDTFRSLLNAVLSNRPLSSAKISVELSGGRDSATVAVAASTLRTDIMSLGIMLSERETLKAQSIRRNTIVKQLGFDDNTISIDDYPPSWDLSLLDQDLMHPYSDFYATAFGRIWDLASASRCDYILSGFGGDELCLPSDYLHTQYANSIKTRPLPDCILTPRALEAARASRTFDAPEGPLPASVYLAHLSHSPAKLERNLWPISPLADPRMAHFANTLPLAIRMDKKFLSEYITNNLSDSLFAANYAKETFTGVINKHIWHHRQHIKNQLRDCALADFGLIDRDALFRLLSSTQGKSLSYEAGIVGFIWLERLMRGVGIR